MFPKTPLLHLSFSPFAFSLALCSPQHSRAERWKEQSETSLLQIGCWVQIQFPNSWCSLEISRLKRESARKRIPCRGGCSAVMAQTPERRGAVGVRPTAMGVSYGGPGDWATRALNHSKNAFFFTPGRVCSQTPCKFAMAGQTGHDSRWAFTEEMWRTSAWGLCTGSAAMSWARSPDGFPVPAQKQGDASTVANEATDLGE